MILVTGGTGLVGAHLLRLLLDSGEKVRAIHRKSSNLEAVRRVFSYGRTKEEAEHLFDQIQWMEADLNDIPALEKAFADIRKVYHCAARVTFDSRDYRSLRKTNIEGTANVVNLCIAHQVEKLCYVSSIATLDLKLGESHYSETSSWNQELRHNMYAITKYGAEMEVWRASQEGVPVIIVKPGVILGPGFWNSGSGVIFSKVYKGLNYYFPKITGFVGVQDVVRAMKQLMDAPIENEHYVLVAENLSFKTLLEQVALSLNKRPPSRPLRPWMISLAWLYQNSLGRLFSGERPLARDSRKSLFAASYYSSEKIKAELGFEFEDLETLISSTGKIFLDEKQEKNSA